MADMQMLLKSECMKLGLRQDVRIVGQHGFRLHLEYKQDPNYPDFARAMIRLERAMQLESARPIDLRLDTKADKNAREKRNVLNER